MVKFPRYKNVPFKSKILVYLIITKLFSISPAQKSNSLSRKMLIYYITYCITRDAFLAAKIY